MTNYDETAGWLKACGKEPNNPEHLRVAVGCAIEEFAEFLRTLTLVSSTGITSSALSELAAHLDACGDVLKKGYAQVEINDREECLDALCDIKVTIDGVGYMGGFDMNEADRRIIASNLSKLNEDGTPVILPGGKLGKSSRYAKADLTGLY